MRSSYKLFRIKGIEVSLHLTLLLLFLMPLLDLFAYNNIAEGLIFAAYSLVFLLVLFGSVLVHELAHSLVAMRNNIRVNQIILTPIGGIASMGAGMVKKASIELKVSLAGPLASLAIGTVLFLLLTAMAGSETLGKAVMSGKFIDEPSLFHIAVMVMYVNLILGLFNLFLPIFPMDGGRVLRSMLCFVTDRMRATRIAVYIGQAFLSVLLVFALIVGSLWLIAIAIFLFFAGLVELRMMEVSEKVKKIDLAKFVVSNLVVLHSGFDSGDIGKIQKKTQSIYPVLDDNGKPVGFLESDKAFEKGKSASNIMSTEPPIARLNDDKDDMLGKVYSNGYVFIVDPKGVFLGVLTMQNLQNALKART